MDFRETPQTSFAQDSYEDNYSYSSTSQRSVVPSNLILDGLSREMRRVLEPSLKPVYLRNEQFLYQEEDRLDYIYFPVTAVVSEFKMLEDGRMVEIAVTGKEGAVGLSALYSNSRVISNCVQVSQAGDAKRVDAVTFEKILRSNEMIRTGLSHSVDVYIRQISQKAICNMYHSVKERFCTWLLMIQDRCGRRTVHLTHEHIARALGVYRPSITYIAQELRESSLISYSRGEILIGDRKRIEAEACTCYLEMAC
jgi:CRP-like cAMP-binding protein